MFGHASETALGQSLDLIVPEEFREAHWKGFRRAISTGSAAAEGQVGEFPVRRADSHCGSTMGRLSLLRSADGTVVGAMVIFG